MISAPCGRRPLMVRVDVVHIDRHHRVQVRQPLRAAEAGFLERGGQHQRVAVQQQLRVAEPAIGHLHPHRLFEAKGRAEELDRRRRVLIAEVRHDSLNVRRWILDHALSSLPDSHVQISNEV